MRSYKQCGHSIFDVVLIDDICPRKVRAGQSVVMLCGCMTEVEHPDIGKGLSFARITQFHSSLQQHL